MIHAAGSVTECKKLEKSKNVNCFSVFQIMFQRNNYSGSQGISIFCFFYLASFRRTRMSPTRMVNP